MFLAQLPGNACQGRRKETDVDEMRAFAQSKAARGKLTEAEFDACMDETEALLRHLQGELDHWIELRDKTETVWANIDYAICYTVLDPDAA